MGERVWIGEWVGWCIDMSGQTAVVVAVVMVLGRLWFFVTVAVAAVAAVAVVVAVVVAFQHAENMVRKT